MIYTLIKKLISYGVNTGLVPEEDVIYTTNRLLELFQLEGMAEVEALELEPAQDDKDAQNTPIEALEGILKGLLEYVKRAPHRHRIFSKGNLRTYE